ncbi:ADP-ribosylglycohydrolase family protein [Streptomyces exfoliatus]|uniref:ADP-ribosylglycohydrolase family protein n=1 Tax=Streptomyces exfoliatus TaxID=1905 RepID=UPI003C2FD77A
MGAVLGSAVGDALGAPFEFGLAGVFRERFPDGIGELCGGGGWDPGEATEFNGAVWPCLGSAVWALRTTCSFEQALAAAVHLGGDTDTVAAVTGMLAGAVYGPDAFTARWTSTLHVPLPGSDGRILRAGDLRDLAKALTEQGGSGAPRPGSPLR